MFPGDYSDGYPDGQMSSIPAFKAAAGLETRLLMRLLTLSDFVFSFDQILVLRLPTRWELTKDCVSSFEDLSSRL